MLTKYAILIGLLMVVPATYLLAYGIRRWRARQAVKREW